ncbi:MAG: hypothetical protein JWO41_250 [Candidatus Saccharibacteria bacterium]|nr:hypothetical protein [Candidatus Saccharibacteria bacterium]
MKNVSIMNTESKINHRLIGYLFTPSWLSAIFCVTVGLLVTAATIVSLQFRGSSLKLLYENYQETHATTVQPLGSTGQVYQTDGLHMLISNAPLLVFWALVGIVVYLLAINVVGALQKARELNLELEFTNGNRRRLLKTVFLHFAVRCLVVAVWLPYIYFFLHHVIPYVLTAAIAGGLLTLDGALDAFLAFAVMAAALHVHIFLLRVLLLRPRVLSRVLYVS